MAYGSWPLSWPSPPASFLTPPPSSTHRCTALKPPPTLAPWLRAEWPRPLPFSLLYWPPSSPPLLVTGNHQWRLTTAFVRPPPLPPIPIKERPGLTSLNHSHSHPSLLSSESIMPSPLRAFGRCHFSPSPGRLTAARPPVSSPVRSPVLHFPSPAPWPLA
jgi:hypothetical protein